MELRIPLKVKRECCRMKQDGCTIQYIYDNYFTKEVENPCSLSSFKRAICKWQKKIFPDETTLECGTYEGFTAHGATVQVSKSGEIVQAWIKQKVSDFDLDDLVHALRENVEIYDYIPKYDEM